MTTTKTTPAQTEALRQLALLGGETRAYRVISGINKNGGFMFFGQTTYTYEDGTVTHTSDLTKFCIDRKEYKSNCRTVRALDSRGLIAIDEHVERTSHSADYTYTISLTEQGRAALR